MVNRPNFCVALNNRPVHIMVHFGDFLALILNFKKIYLFSAIDYFHGEHAASQVEHFLVSDLGFPLQRVRLFGRLRDMG